MLSNPTTKVVTVDRQPAQPAGRVHSFDAVIAAMAEDVGRIEVRPLTDADRRLAAMFASDLDRPSPRLSRLSRRARQP